MLDLPDVPRVEVLRGPQGTLYGRNSDAGAVRLITHDPTDTLHIVSDIGLGDYGAVQTHDLISGPIVPGIVEGSLAFVHSEPDGTTKDPTIHLADPPNPSPCMEVSRVHRHARWPKNWRDDVDFRSPRSSL